MTSKITAVQHVVTIELVNGEPLCGANCTYLQRKRRLLGKGEYHRCMMFAMPLYPTANGEALQRAVECVERFGVPTVVEVEKRVRKPKKKTKEERHAETEITGFGK